MTVRGYRSADRLVMDLLAALKRDGPVGITRVMQVANLTHERAQALLDDFQRRGWVVADRSDERSRWVLTEKGARVLSDLRRVDDAMQDHGLGF